MLGFIVCAETPDMVSISPPSLEGLVEGESYSIRCDILNVAPVSNLSVHWHRGDTILYTERFDGSSLSPVNKTSVFNLTAQRGDEEAPIWCEAQLDFWRPVPNLPTIKSESRDVTVLCTFFRRHLDFPVPVGGEHWACFSAFL